MSKVRNREAVAIFLAGQNVLHDAVHAGLLNAEQVIALTIVTQQDFITLMKDGKLAVREHDDMFLEIDGPQGDNVQEMLDTLSQAAMEQKVDPNMPKPTVVPEKKVLN